MRVNVGSVALEVDDQGAVQDEPMLLIMGLGMQLTAWPDELVRLLVMRGFRVVRFDNRDAGLSQGFETAGIPSIPWATMRYLLRMPLRSPYSLRDMADDAVGLLDALGIERAHVCGASLGGMVAQHLAATHPDRVRSLALIMTTTGARHLPKPSPRVRRVFARRPPGHHRDAVVSHVERIFDAIGSPAYGDDAMRRRRRIEAAVARAWRPDGTARQLMAVLADADRTSLLPRIGVPTVVIHGQEDPLVPAVCGVELARHIAGAQLDLIPGMGHDLPDELLERIADDLARNARRAAALTAAG
jgi:pimeloyl-ACP methyl ester carboxylesterase